MRKARLLAAFGQEIPLAFNTGGLYDARTHAAKKDRQREARRASRQLGRLRGSSGAPSSSAPALP
eukprot:6203755-Pleurochrysis_carterae.AAC.1